MSVSRALGHTNGLTLKVATTTRVTFSLTADFATLVSSAMTSYFLMISACNESRKSHSLVHTLRGGLLE